MLEGVKTESELVAPIAGLWRRLGAMLLDAVILGAAGFPLGLLLGEHLAPAGTPARLLGLLVAIPYLGIMGSRVGGGQTVGKRLANIRIVNSAGQPLSLLQSCARASLLCLPWFMNGTRFPPMGRGGLAAVGASLAALSSVVVFGLGVAIIVAVLLNRRTRQAAHDLVVGSYVVMAHAVHRAPAERSSRAPAVAVAAWIVLVSLAGIASQLIGTPLAPIVPSPQLIGALGAIPGSGSFEVRDLTMYAWSGRSHRSLQVTVWYRGSKAQQERVARDVANAILRYQPRASEARTLSVTLVTGWDIGIASMTSSSAWVRRPEEWA